ITSRQRAMLPLFVELGADGFLPHAATRDGWRVSVAGMGAKSQLCAHFVAGRFELDPCAGVWLRVLEVGALRAQVGELAARAYTLTGWDVRANVGLQLDERWSLFASGHVLVGFEEQSMRFRGEGDAVAGTGGAPFFNADPDGGSTPASPFYRVATFGGAVQLGAAAAF
ncbi:MAG TPA: hypothetical protein VJR89_22535, partial [Polyangiales bacterium]|nr:hypothetical protein [Polyangiales bacterium]